MITIAFAIFFAGVAMGCWLMKLVAR